MNNLIVRLAINALAIYLAVGTGWIQGIEAQTQGAKQISEAIDQLNEGAQQTAESLTQTSASISQLHNAALGLQESAAQFKVETDYEDASAPV